MTSSAALEIPEYLRVRPIEVSPATVIGWTAGRLVTIRPNRKSFQMEVNCQMITTTKPGIESGKSTQR